MKEKFFKQQEVRRENQAVSSLVGMIGTLGEKWKPVSIVDSDRVRILEEKAKSFATVIASSPTEDRQQVDLLIEGIRNSYGGNEGFADDLTRLIKDAEAKLKEEHG